MRMLAQKPWRGSGPRAVSPRLCTVALSALLLTGCRGAQSALDPRGPQAGRIAGLWWLTFWVCTVVYVLVLLVVAGALVLKRRKGPPVAKDPTAPVRDPRGGP